jgi:hypothetical protein
MEPMGNESAEDEGRKNEPTTTTTKKDVGGKLAYYQQRVTLYASKTKKLLEDFDNAPTPVDQAQAMTVMILRQIIEEQNNFVLEFVNDIISQVHASQAQFHQHGPTKKKRKITVTTVNNSQTETHDGSPLKTKKTSKNPNAKPPSPASEGNPNPLTSEERGVVKKFIEEEERSFLLNISLMKLGFEDVTIKSASEFYKLEVSTQRKLKKEIDEVRHEYFNIISL